MDNSIKMDVSDFVSPAEAFASLRIQRNIVRTTQAELNRQLGEINWQKTSLTWDADRENTIKSAYCIRPAIDLAEVKT